MPAITWLAQMLTIAFRTLRRAGRCRSAPRPYTISTLPLRMQFMSNILTNNISTRFVSIYVTNLRRGCCGTRPVSLRMRVRHLSCIVLYGCLFNFIVLYQLNECEMTKKWTISMQFNADLESCLQRKHIFIAIELVLKVTLESQQVFCSNLSSIFLFPW
jgi:hypothetical protein